MNLSLGQGWTKRTKEIARQPVNVCGMHWGCNTLDFLLAGISFAKVPAKLSWLMRERDQLTWWIPRISPWSKSCSNEGAHSIQISPYPGGWLLLLTAVSWKLWPKLKSFCYMYDCHSSYGYILPAVHFFVRDETWCLCSACSHCSWICVEKNSVSLYCLCYFINNSLPLYHCWAGSSACAYCQPSYSASLWELIPCVWGSFYRRGPTWDSQASPFTNW